MVKSQVLKNILLIVFCFLLNSFINAQNPYALHLNKTNGLPSNAVFDIKQDKNGFIWLATNDGLTRYDGFEYKNFTCEAQTSIAGSCLKEDVLGRMWYENFDGNLYYVDSTRKELNAFKNNTPIGFVPFHVNKKNLFFFQKNGIDVYDIKSLAFLKTISFSFYTLSHTASKGENLFFINENTLYKVNEAFEISTVVLNDFEAGQNKQIYASDNQLFIVSKLNETEKIQVYDFDLKKIETLSLTEPSFIQGLSFFNNNIWIHTTQGTFVKNGNEMVAHYFPDNSISSVLKDAQNNYWFTTTNEGVFIVQNLSNTLQTLNNYLPSKIVKYKNGNYLMGTKKGELLKVNSTFTNFELVYQSPEKGNFSFLYYDTLRNQIALSTNGFTILNANSFKIEKFENYAIKEIVPLDSSYFAFASSSVLGVFKNTYFKSFTSNFDNIKIENQALRNDFIHLLENIRAKSVAYNTDKKIIYYATNIGLYKVVGNNIIEIKLNNESFFANKIVYTNSVKYALSNKGELYKIDSEENFELLNTAFNFKQNGVKAIKLFDENLLILNSESLYNLNCKTQELKKYDINISTYELNDLVIVNEKLIIVTNSGIISTQLQIANSSTLSSSKFYINEFKVGSKSINTVDNFQFTYNENIVSIHFSILDYGKINSEIAYYKINDEDWKMISSETRHLDFPSLSPGTYNITFKLGENIQKETFRFTILKPFWFRWWFAALVILSLATLSYFYYRYRMSKLVTQIKLLNENIELEKSLNKSVLKTIKAQMNPHFFYNALNTIQAYIFTNDSDNAYKYLSKFSKLTRKILEMSEHEEILLSEEIETLTLYLDLEKVRFDEDFDFEINTNHSLDLDSIFFPSMLIQPYVENAVKHGLLHKTGLKKLFISFTLEDKNNLEIVIEDNGIGRKRAEALNNIKNEKHASFSTEANAKRLELLNQNSNNKLGIEIMDLVDADNNPLGTKVIIKVPIKN